MNARTVLFVFAATLSCGAAAPLAHGGDFGISFHYRSHSPGYYSSNVYTTCPPRSYVYYGDPVAYSGPVVYESTYPTTYRQTYTRSRYYTRPVYRSHRTVYRTAPSRQVVVSRRHYASPRASIHISGHRDHHSYRDRHAHSRYRGSHHGHHRSPIRVHIRRH